MTDRWLSKRSKMFAIDQDFPKEILAHVGMVWMRLSPSGKGLHWLWHCPLGGCKDCERWKARLDDARRLKRDLERSPLSRNVLWDRKGQKTAGPWLFFHDVNQSKQRRKHG